MKSNYVLNSLLIVSLSLAACAQHAGGKVAHDDEYTNAAMSWKGADIREMLTAWPEPNIMGCGSNKKDETGSVGCVRWRHVRQNQIANPASQTVSHYPYYHCETAVEYGADGIIAVVDVMVSSDCGRLFSADDFVRLTH